MTKPLIDTVTKHARLCGASSAHRWHPCNGSAFLSMSYPNKPNEYALLGSAAHYVSKRCIEAGGMFDVGDFIGTEIYIEGESVIFPEKYAEYARVYVDAILKEKGNWTELHVEKTLNLQPIAQEPEAVCTPDALFLRIENGVSAIRIDDLKTGHRRVPAKGNLQEILYYGAALQAHNTRYAFSTTLREVTFAIHQPTISDTPDIWTEDYRAINADYLIPMQKSAWNIVNNIKDQNTALKFLNPGEKQCEWCAFRTDCPALSKQVYAAHELMFADETEDIITPAGAAHRLTPAQLADVLDKADVIRSFLDACELRGLEDALHGNPPTGFKLVEGKPGHRAWADESAVRNVLLESHNGDTELVDSVYMDHSLKSPAQLEKALKKQGRPLIMQSLEENGAIRRPAGKPRLVREDHPAPAITSKVVFDDEHPPALLPEDLI